MQLNHSVINHLINQYDINIIEKHLINSFLVKNNLQYYKSLLLSKYLDDYTLDKDINDLISTLNINDLKVLEKYLELLIPKNDRKVNGAFFTPTYIVDFIINETSPKATDKCLDPSCGCGAFLIGLVEYFQNKFNKSIKETIKTNIFGSDILSYNINRSKILLSLYGLLHDEIIEESDFNLYNQDSLKSKWKNKFDIVVGNPPYVKFQDMSDDYRNYLINNWDSIQNGTFNMYFAFFELGYNLITENGKLGYITPNNYFTSLSAISLRNYFMENKCVTKILDFRHKKVFEAQTYTAITFLDRHINESILFDKIKDQQSCSEFLNNAHGSINYIKDLDVNKWRLLKTDDQENIKTIESIGTPIKQLFNIAAGIATLKDQVFLIDSKNERDGYLTKTNEKGTFLIEKSITKPVYKISNFKNQNDIKNNTLRIITPYYTNSKKAIPILEDEFSQKFPKCYEYLLSEKEKLKSRGKGKKAFSPFYAWGRTQGITRFGKKVLNPTFSKHPRFLYVPEEDAYYTNGYGIYFNKSDNSNLFSHEMSKEENILIVQKILNSIIMDYYVSNTSVSIQGGFPCYQKNFIEKFTIPNFSQEEINLLEKLDDKSEIDKFLIKKYQVSIPLPNRDS